MGLREPDLVDWYILNVRGSSDKFRNCHESCLQIIVSDSCREKDTLRETLHSLRIYTVSRLTKMTVAGSSD